MNNEIWDKLGPYSCLLNIDETGISYILYKICLTLDWKSKKLKYIN
jgi:hypothetical protein